MCFMNFKDGFNKILNSTILFTIVGLSLVGFLFIFLIVRVTERPATQTKASATQVWVATIYSNNIYKLAAESPLFINRL